MGDPAEGSAIIRYTMISSSRSMHVGCAKHNVDLRWLEFGPTCHLPSKFKMIRWGNTQGLLPHLE